MYTGILVCRTYTAHQCPNSGLKDCVSFKCPLCSKTVALMANQNANEVWEIHSATECDPSKRKTKKPRCSVSGCREVMGPSNRSVCESCRKEVSQSQPVGQAVQEMSYSTRNQL